MLKIVHCTKFEHWCSYANPAAQVKKTFLLFDLKLMYSYVIEVADSESDLGLCNICVVL